jgi:hypothetical protein
MAVKAVPKLNAHALRADFPIFDQEIHGKPLAFRLAASLRSRGRCSMR